MFNECEAEAMVRDSEAEPGGIHTVRWSGVRRTLESRAHWTGPKFQAIYQVRRPGGRWPTRWSSTKDLPKDVALLGLDVKWEYVPETVKRWLKGFGPRPRIRRGR